MRKQRPVAGRARERDLFTAGAHVVYAARLHASIVDHDSAATDSVTRQNGKIFLYDSSLHRGPFMGCRWPVCKVMHIRKACLRSLFFAAPVEQ